MMRAGEFWELPTPALRTNATASGSLLPTLLAAKQTQSGELANADGTPWDGMSKPHSATTGRPVTTALADKLVRLPTLVKRDGARVDCPAEHRRNSPPLIAMLNKLPTLTVCGNYNRKGASPESGDGLATALKKLPTLTAQDAKNCGGPSQMERNTPPLNALAGGPLNPEWCEWFMGCPLGWTELSALETDRFRQWCASHGVSSVNCNHETTTP